LSENLFFLNPDPKRFQAKEKNGSTGTTNSYLKEKSRGRKKVGRGKGMSIIINKGDCFFGGERGFLQNNKAGGNKKRGNVF